MRKFLTALLVLCAVLACSFMTACNNVSKEDYDKLNNQYNNVLKEKNDLEEISSWLDLYKSIKMGKSFNEISVLFDFEYASHEWGSDNETSKMDAYIWRNNNLFDYIHAAENQIVVVFHNDVAIFKQYGNLNFVFSTDEGIVFFPSHK